MVLRRDRRPPPPGQFVNVNGINWHYESAGKGPLGLLLLHGYLGSTAGWRRVLPMVGRHVRVVAADMPGAGYSDRPAGAPYTLPWIAGQLPDLLKALGMERPFIGGHSLGASVALHAAARFPELASGLVLASPLAYRQLPPPGLRIAKNHPGLMGRFFASPIGKAVIPTLVRRAGFAGDEAKGGVTARTLINHLDAPGGWEAATKMGLLAGESAPDKETLGSIRVPALIAWGAMDKVHGVDFAKRVCCDLGGGARLVVLNRSAHNCHEEQWRDFSTEVLDFVLGSDGTILVP